MKRLKISLVILAWCCALGYAEKTCTVGDEELTVADDVDCSALSPLLSGDPTILSRSERSAPYMFWQGFPFPPGMRFPGTFPNWRQWLRPPRRRRRPRPDDDIEECPDEGIKFISHPTDCEKYILCVDGEEMVTLTCPDGMHFSRDLRECAPKRIAGCEDFDLECPDEDDPNNLVFLPNEEDCNAYYLCWGGLPIPMNCPPGQHWSMVQEECMHPILANCPFEFSVAGAQQQPSAAAIAAKLDTVDVVPAARIVQRAANVRCPRTGVHQLANPDDCEKFFLCVNGERTERNCPRGLHFSAETSTCVAPETAGCDSVSCPRNSPGVSFLPNTDDCSRYFICIAGTPIARECLNGLHWSARENACVAPAAANCDFGDSVDCPRRGIHQLPHPDDCEKFYMCVNGEGVERSCANGLHFSANTSTCQPPAIAGCESQIDCPQRGIHQIAHPDDCEKFYMCINGEGVERSCPNGLHFSKNNSNCESPATAGCESQIDCPQRGIHQLAHPDDCEKFYMCVNGEGVERSCPNGLHFSPETSNCQPPEKAGCDSVSCPRNVTGVSFLPNEDDCGKYYICIAGNPVERECSNGMHWSVEDSECKSPDEANCAFGISVNCPRFGVHQLPHPDDCEKFYMCINGDGVEVSCPPGLHFSPDTNNCMPPELAGCVMVDCPRRGIHQVPHPDDCEQFFLCVNGEGVPRTCPAGLHFSPETNNCLPPEIAGCEVTVDCPRRGIHQLPHPEDCEKFFLCVNGEGVLRECPAGLHFSPDTNTCQDPEIAGCVIVDCPPRGIAQVPHPDDCEQFFLCLNGEGVPRSCPPGLHFSPETNTCLPPDIAGCEVTVDCPPRGIHQLPHPEDCEKFFMCINGEGVLRTCPPGMHFSPDTNNCLPEEIAGCVIVDCPPRGIHQVPHPEDCEQFFLCVNGEGVARPCPPGLHFSPDTNTCLPPAIANCEVEVDCPRRGIHQLPHPTDCEQFFLCVNGEGVPRSCPNGLHFSPHLLQCAPPEEAGCDEWSCPTEDSDKISFIPNTDDCASFFVCLEGEQILRECPDGLHWSIAGSMCLEPDEANCPYDAKVECPARGIHHLKHPDKCNEYFLCINGRKLHRSCPPRTHFSPHLEICTSPAEAGCDEWQCPPGGGISFIPNVDDCGSYFICIAGNPVLRQCAPGLHWSIAQNTCLHPILAQCTFGFSCPDTGVHQLPKPDSCEEFYMCVNGEEMERSCPRGLHFSPHTKECMEPELAGCEGWDCPRNSREVRMIPNTEDCRAYYICMMGNKMPMTCPGNQHFSIANGICMSQRDANCPFDTPRRFNLEAEKEEQKQEEKEEEKAETHSIQKRSAPRFFSNADCPPTGIASVPNPEDCETYYLCINGMALPRRCAPDLHFSPDEGVCMDPDEAGCDVGCPPGGISFLPHAYDCEKYYLCFGGVQHLMRCPHEWHWSVEENSCMDPLEAGCKDFDDIIECPEVGIEQIPYPDDCERFVLCVNGLEIPMSCAPGLHFSPSERTCMPPEDAGCKDDYYVWKCPEEDTPGVIVFIPNTEDCTRYYLCWGGNQIPLSCGAGLHWSIEENRCMLPEDANCPWWDDKFEEEECPEEGLKAISSVESCEQYYLCINGFQIPMTCSAGMHFCRDMRICRHPLVANCILPSMEINAIQVPVGPVLATSEEDSCPVIESRDEMVFVPHSKSCQSYFLCMKNQSVLFNCAEGLAWNADKKKCMLESKANCTI